MGRPATGSVLPPDEHSDKYRLRFTAYKERRYITLGTEADGWTRDRAEAELKHVLADVERGIWRPPNPVIEAAPAPDDDPTFHRFASEWFAMRESEGLAPSTLDAIRWRLTDVLLPFFQHHRLSQITVAEVDCYRAHQVRERDRLAAARERGTDTPSRPLSNNTINRTITLLGQILDVAVEYGHIPANTARGNRRKLKADKPRRPYLDAAHQVTALLDAAGELDREARADRQHVNRRGLLAMLIFTGLRISELLALRWRDVDLAGGWLNIRGSKTAAGIRKVKIRPVLRDVLAALKPLDANPDAYVFGTATGARQCATNVRNRILAKAVERANDRLLAAGEAELPKLTPHALRRTFASVLYAIGDDPGIVMDELGHEHADLALTVYRQSMRRDDGEKDRLRALVNGESFGSFGSGTDIERATELGERPA